MLHLAGLLGMDGGTYRSVEFAGSYIDTLPDARADRFLEHVHRNGRQMRADRPGCRSRSIIWSTKRRPRHRLTCFSPVNPRYERVIEIDVSQLEPQVACHPDVDHVKPLAEVAGLPIDQVYIGTCTNARYEDLEIAAQDAQRPAGAAASRARSSPPPATRFTRKR